MEPKIPSARRGIKLLDTVKKAGFDSMDEFQKFLTSMGKPMIGTTGGEESLKLLNSLVLDKDKYVKMYPDYVKMEEDTLKTKNPSIKKLKGPELAQDILTISAEAETKFPGKMTKAKQSFIQKALKQANILIDDAAKLGLKSMLAVTGPIGATIGVALELATAPKAEAAELPKKSMEETIRENVDFSRPSASSMLLEQMKQDATMKAGGGMMNINQMIRPIGR